MNKLPKYDRKNDAHHPVMRAILIDCARRELKWELLVAEVKKRFEVKNWIHVRHVLQELRNAGIVSRTDDVHEEVWVLTKK